MGLNRVDNPAKLRRLSLVIGHPVIRAYSRWFANQNTLLVFTDPTTAWVVERDGTFERYTEQQVELLEHGIRTVSTSGDAAHG